MIEIKVELGGVVTPNKIILGNKWENNDEILSFVCPEDFKDYHKYLIGVIKQSSGNHTTIIPITNNTCHVSSSLTYFHGNWNLYLMCRELPLDLSGDIIDIKHKENERVFISDVFIGVVNKNMINQEDIENIPLDTNLKVVYEDLLTLKDEVRYYLTHDSESDLAMKTSIDQNTEDTKVDNTLEFAKTYADNQIDIAANEISNTIPKKISQLEIDMELGTKDYNDLENKPDIPSKLSDLEIDMEVGGASSWNDLEDRPFYSEVQPVELVNETVTFNDFMGDGSSYLGQITTDLEKNTNEIDEIKIVWDNVEYVCTYKNNEILGTILGNEAIINAMMQGNTSYEDTGEPFLVYMGRGFLTVSTEPQHSIAVFVDRIVDIPIPHKYLGINMKNGEGENSVILGNINTNVASGNGAYVEGSYNTSSGSDSHAEGCNVKASGNYSHAQGNNTVANRCSMNVIGEHNEYEDLPPYTEDIYESSMGGGYNSFYSADSYTFDENIGKYTLVDYEIVETVEVGKYILSNRGQNGVYHHISEVLEVNENGYPTKTMTHIAYSTAYHRGKYAHVVGNGTYNKRSNAHTLDWEGNAWFAGDVQATDTEGNTVSLVNHTHSFNDLEDKPFGDTVNTVEITGGVTLSYDGVVGDREFHDYNYMGLGVVKVSDMVFTKEQLIGGATSLTYSGDEIEWVPITGENFEEYEDYIMFNAEIGQVAIIKTDTVLNDATFTKGTWFGGVYLRGSVSTYQLKTNPEYPIIVEEVEVKQLDPKYINAYTTEEIDAMFASLINGEEVEF